ncbi:hypothetical protein MSG28_010923 [Choristoneura fumiferana]|uniref:Uncharacterized protein n=1 Tax=Choristoneura fumiferana TaxID=7141 RepID=A0ACC0KPW6_CHOFU|nr:hypothetical protein MSG28_010923 [Choristoneura fumiferana]
MQSHATRIANRPASADSASIPMAWGVVSVRRIFAFLAKESSSGLRGSERSGALQGIGVCGMHNKAED